MKKIIRRHLICVPVFLLILSSLKAQSGHAWSLFASGVIVQNNGGLIALTDNEIDFQNPNTAINIGLNYRKYTSSSISYELGLRYGSRNFKTTAYSIEDILNNGRDQTFGQVNVAYPKSLAIPFRVFLGAAPDRRADRNRSSGIFLGTTLQYNIYPSFVGLPEQQALYEAFQQRIVPHFNFGGRTMGRWLNLQIEFMVPVKSGKLEFVSDGSSYSPRFKEFYWSIGIGHTFGK